MFHLLQKLAKKSKDDLDEQIDENRNLHYKLSNKERQIDELKLKNEKLTESLDVQKRSNSTRENQLNTKINKLSLDLDKVQNKQIHSLGKY